MALALVVAAFGFAAASGTSTCRRQPPHTEPAPAPAPAYAALGSGHLLREVSGDGRYITLEDGSSWEVLPSDQFESADWQPLASMTVRSARGENGFNYQLVNTTDDEGVMAKFIPRH